MIDPFPPTERPFYAPQPPAPAVISVPMLISAIFNVIIAAGWGTTCVFSPVGFPFLVLAIFEIMTFTRLRAPGPHDIIAGRVRVIAILQICTIVTGNVPSLVCGIVTLTHLDQLNRR